MSSRERHLWDDLETAGRPRGWSVEHALAVLNSGDITAAELIPWGSNYTFAVRVECEAEACLGVYKPLRGEAPLWDFPNGLYKREYAAYALCALLGWGFVPPTIVRDGPHGLGSLQLYVQPEQADYLSFREQHVAELQRICLFDVIANNADRKAGHCLKGLDGHIWGIDHGLTFNVQPKLRTVIWDFSGERVPEALEDELLDFRTDSARIRELYRCMDGYLYKEELAMLLKRIDAVLAHPVFPATSSRRAYPWPLY